MTARDPHVDKGALSAQERRYEQDLDGRSSGTETQEFPAVPDSAFVDTQHPEATSPPAGDAETKDADHDD
jgi:hypothetical protein